MQRSTSFQSSEAPFGSLTNDPRHRLAACLTSIIATGFLLIACDGDVAADNPEDQRVPITLVHPKSAATIDLLVPAAYLGPSVLPTSIENRQGGKYEKLLVQFSYPSMTPPADVSAPGSAMDVYAEVYAAMRGATRSFAEGRLSRRKGAYDQSDGKICGLQEYRSKTMLAQTGQEFHAWIYYYYRDPTEAVNDVYVNCMDIAMDGDPKCRYYFETEGGLQVVLNLVPRSQLCQWSEMTAQVADFLDGFVVVE
jgi:hypothetical protein